MRPHVINPSDLPPGVVQATDVQDEVKIPIDPRNWEIITDAMAAVVNPGGTAPSAHLQNIDFAGKTGSSQTISNALKAKLGAEGKAKFKDNGWFVGVEPRRNPEIVVCTLLEEGEHGYLAARTAAKVIKAYVDKQRRTPPPKMAGQPQPNNGGKVEISGVWTLPDSEEGKDRLQGGRFVIGLPKKKIQRSLDPPRFRGRQRPAAGWTVRDRFAKEENGTSDGGAGSELVASCKYRAPSEC